MGLIIPAAVNYQNPLVAVPSRVLNAPNEGNKQISCEVDWTAALVGPGKTVAVNFSNNATLAFSQIIALKVDNSQCGGDVQFIFPDTGDTVEIPAYAPVVIVPVFTHSQNFFVSSPGSQAQDITRFQILNYLPPPVSVPTSQEQNSSGNVDIPMVVNGGAPVTIVAAGISGTLEAIHLVARWQTASAAFDCGISILDSRPVYLLKTGVGGNNASSFTGLIADLNPCNLRFIGGLYLTFDVSGSLPAAGGFVTPTLLYRTP